MTRHPAQHESTGKGAPGTTPEAVGVQAGHPVGDVPSRLSPQQFADQMTAAYGRLWGLAAALVGDRHEAEDLVQEAAIVALRKITDFTPETNFVAWMAKIIRMHALNWRRKRKGRQTTAADPSDLDSRTASPSTQTVTPSVADAAKGQTPSLQEDFDDALLGSLQSLDVTPRACLMLRVVHELSYDEIATMLEIPAGTAMSHVHRSKQRLRTELDSNTTGNH